MSLLQIRGVGTSWAVYLDDQRITQDYTSRTSAETKANRLEAALKVTVRPCMRCGCTFPSSGKHHRLCDDCREVARQALL